MITSKNSFALKPQTVAEAVAQIEKCEFECEGGLLANNVGWRFLVAALNVGPEFWPGQSVWFQVDAVSGDVKLTQWVKFFIVGCQMSSDTERRLWLYDLSYDPPSPWHYGTTQFKGVSGSKLRLEKPQEGAAS